MIIDHFLVFVYSSSIPCRVERLPSGPCWRWRPGATEPTSCSTGHRWPPQNDQHTSSPSPTDLPLVSFIDNSPLHNRDITASLPVQNSSQGTVQLTTQTDGQFSVPVSVSFHSRPFALQRQALENTQVVPFIQPDTSNLATSLSDLQSPRHQLAGLLYVHPNQVVTSNLIIFPQDFSLSHLL